jgi:hypothetical protein
MENRVLIVKNLSKLLLLEYLSDKTTQTIISNGFVKTFGCLFSNEFIRYTEIASGYFLGFVSCSMCFSVKKDISQDSFIDYISSCLEDSKEIKMGQKDYLVAFQDTKVERPRFLQSLHRDVQDHPLPLLLPPQPQLDGVENFRVPKPRVQHLNDVSQHHQSPQQPKPLPAPQQLDDAGNLTVPKPKVPQQQPQQPQQPQQLKPQLYQQFYQQPYQQLYQQPYQQPPKYQDHGPQQSLQVVQPPRIANILRRVDGPDGPHYIHIPPDVDDLPVHPFPQIPPAPQNPPVLQVHQGYRQGNKKGRNGRANGNQAQPVVIQQDMMADDLYE